MPRHIVPLLVVRGVLRVAELVEDGLDVDISSAGIEVTVEGLLGQHRRIDDGRMVIKSDDELGGVAAKYRWGQNETEVLIRWRGPKTLKLGPTRLQALKAPRGFKTINFKGLADVA